MKFISKKNNKNVLSLSADDFASLVEYDNGKSVYDFTYAIDTAEALKRGGQKVEINVVPIDLPKSPSIFSFNSISNKPSPTVLAQNIQKIVSLKKDTKDSNNNAILSKAVSDFTTKVSNKNLFAPIKTVKYKLALASTINQKNENEPILQISTLKTTNTSKSISSLSIDSILKDKEDPSNIQQKYTIGTKKSFQGMAVEQISSNLKKSLDTLSKKVLLKSGLTNSNQLGGSSVVPIINKEDEKFRVITKRMKFGPEQLVDSAEFIVKFNLIGLNGLVLETISRKVDHVQNVKIIQTPLISPTITSITLPARNLLTITQNDPLATSVDIYRKFFKRTQRIDEQKYVFVANVSVSKKNSVPFEDLVGNASDAVYRVIPKGEQNQSGPVYTNKVVPAYKFGIPRERTLRLLYAGIVAQSHPQGVFIEVVGLAPGVSAIKLLAKNRTRGDKDFRTVPSFTNRQLTVLTSDTNQTYAFLDTQAKDFHVMEYAVMLLFENGDEEVSISREVYKNVPFSFGVVDTTISQPQISQTSNGVDVQFDINSTITDNNISTLKKMLEQQGQADLFASELANEKTSLNKLIAHQIRRVDLTTGETEYFKVFTGTRFSDENRRKVDGVSPLVPGRVYRYVVSALLRSAETLFEDNIQTIENSIGIKVNVLPLKFKHPVVQQHGSLVTKKSLKVNHSEEPFEFGNIGNFVAKDVSIDIAKPKASNAKVIKFNSRTNVIRWTVLGDKTLLDHFLVALERFGDEEIIGRVHTSFKSNIIEFIDKEGPKEPGSYRYRIIPVQKNYSHAPSIYTQEIV